MTQPTGDASRKLEDAVQSITCATDVMRLIATANISCGEDIGEAVIDWLARRIEEDANRAREAAEAIDRAPHHETEVAKILRRDE